MAYRFPGTQQTRPRPAYRAAGVDIDLGLRQYRLCVYNLVAGGLAGK